MVKASKLWINHERLSENVTIVDRTKTRDTYGRTTGLNDGTAQALALWDETQVHGRDANRGGKEDSGKSSVHFHYDVVINLGDAIVDARDNTWIILSHDQILRNEDGEPVYRVYTAQMAEKDQTAP